MVSTDALSNCENLMDYTIYQGTAWISGYRGSESSIVIPSVIDGLPVAGIADYAFEDRSDLISIRLPDTMQAIGSYAFSGCTALSSVKLPKSLKSIGPCAFHNCASLTHIYLPKELETLGSNVFTSCKQMQSITFRGSVPALDADALQGVSAIVFYPPEDSSWIAYAKKTNNERLAWKTYPVVKASNAASTGKIKLTWTETEGAEKYKVYRSQSKSGTYQLLNTTSNAHLTDTSTKAVSTYYYKVKAVIAAETSANAYVEANLDEATEQKVSVYSPVIHRTCDLPRPDVSIRRNSIGEPRLDWTAISGALKYKVYRSTSKDGTYKLCKTITRTNYTDETATWGKLYYYKVLAVASKSAADSAYSKIVSITAK